MKASVRIVMTAASAVLLTPIALHATPPKPASCTLATSMVNFVGYVDCKGPFVGNINGNEVAQLNGFLGFWAGTWTYLGSSDDNNSGGPFSYDPGKNNTLSGASLGFDTPIKGRFAVGIKQCDYYSWYLYDEASLISTVKISSQGTCGNDGFSHVVLYSQAGGGTGTINEIVTPEPATMTMLATGLVGLVGAGVRRRKKA